MAPGPIEQFNQLREGMQGYEKMFNGRDGKYAPYLENLKIKAQNPMADPKKLPTNKMINEIVYLPKN